MKQDASILIRCLEAADVPAVHRLETECFSMPWSEAALYGVLHDGVSHFYVAESEGQIVGSCGVMLLCGEGDISNVAVQQSFRGKGIAYAMLTRLLSESEALGIHDFTLEVRVSNTPAIRLYEKLGFVSEGIRPRFYERPIEDALIMWRR